MSRSGNWSTAWLIALVAGGCGDDDNTGNVDASTVGTGPGATLKCDSTGKNAFDTYGANAFVAVNKKIFANVNAEITANSTTNLGDSFTKIGTGTPASTADNAAKFEGKLAAFLVYAYGGPTDITYSDGVSYHGPQDMVAAHTGLAITSAQYDYFIGMIVVPALTSSGVAHGTGGSASPDDVSTCFAPIVTDATFKASIVGK
jgi:hypothetical protein